jgi:nucleotide-binding universal stress UspA family protein
MTEPQLVMERPGQVGARKLPAAASTTVKTILVHVQDDASLDQRIEAALSLARSASAHLSFIHVTPVQAYVAFDSFGGVFVMNDVIKALDEQEAKLSSRIREQLRSEDVSWDYEQVTADIASTLIARAALADLVVAGRSPHRDDFNLPATGLLGDLLYRGRSPLFVPGDERTTLDPTGPAIVAWDGSYEAANAVRSSVGLLKLASSVRVVRVTEQKEDDFPGTKLLQYLSRQGIEAELGIETPPSDGADSDVVAAALVACARASGAAFMVMGGYSHSRVREFVFGGVTRALLKSCPVALVIAH